MQFWPVRALIENTSLTFLVENFQFDYFSEPRYSF